MNMFQAGPRCSEGIGTWIRGGSSEDTHLQQRKPLGNCVGPNPVSFRDFRASLGSQKNCTYIYEHIYFQLMTQYWKLLSHHGHPWPPKQHQTNREVPIYAVSFVSSKGLGKVPQEEEKGSYGSSWSCCWVNGFFPLGTLIGAHQTHAHDLDDVVCESESHWVGYQLIVILLWHAMWCMSLYKHFALTQQHLLDMDA